MLHCEERQEPGVDREADTQGPTCGTVKRPRDAEVADETDSVKKRSQEDQVAKTSVGEE
jgi:hypothetical protein